MTAATASWGTGESAPLGAQMNEICDEDKRKLSAQQLAHIWPRFAFVAGLLVPYRPLAIEFSSKHVQTAVEIPNPA